MKLYKYSSITGAIGILKDNGVKLNSPIFFNDSFDSKFVIDEQENKSAFQIYRKFRLFSAFVEGVIDSKIKVPKTLREQIIYEYKTYLKEIETNKKFFCK